jgi:uncharacterized membrane protein
MMAAICNFLKSIVSIFKQIPLNDMASRSAKFIRSI